MRINDPCVGWCQYAMDIGVDHHSCGGQFCEHYVDRVASEEMLPNACWLHGQTLWRFNFETLWWSCPLDGCDSRIGDEKVVTRKLPKILVPPMFGFSARLP